MSGIYITIELVRCFETDGEAFDIGLYCDFYFFVYGAQIYVTSCFLLT